LPFDEAGFKEEVEEAVTRRSEELEEDLEDSSRRRHRIIE
jgi:hypothetical protein